MVAKIRQNGEDGWIYSRRRARDNFLRQAATVFSAKKKNMRKNFLLTDSWNRFKSRRNRVTR